MKKGIWWLFGGIGLSAIVFAVLLATNVVSLHDNSSNDNSNNNLVSNEEDICRLNKKVDGVEYLFLVSKLEDLYYLNVYYIGDRAHTAAVLHIFTKTSRMRPTVIRIFPTHPRSLHAKNFQQIFRLICLF